MKKFKKPRILAVTLARSGSKSVKNKNLARLAGKPLLYDTVKQALKSKLISRYIVSTDSKKIQSYAKKIGAEAPFLRPKKLSNDKASAVSADLHALKWAEKDENLKYDYFVELMATNPLKNFKDIDNVLNKLIKTKADSVIGMVKVDDHHPLRIKRLVNGKIRDFKKNLKEIPEMHRQQLKPKAYIRNGSIYAAKRDLIYKKKRYGTNNSRPYVMDEMRSINIDNKIDFFLAETLIKQKKKL